MVKFDLVNVTIITLSLVVLACHLQASWFALYVKKTTEIVHSNGGEFVAILVALSL